MSHIWGPKVVIGVFTLAGGLIGGDVALWPWSQPMSFEIPVAVGLLSGFLAGAFIAWAIREVEVLKN